MCLIVNRIRHLNGKAKIAKHDIPCYKVLSITYADHLQTPCMCHAISQDTIVNGLIADHFEHTRSSFRINHGIHSYKQRPKYVSKNCIVVNAYIPKGTPYWISYNDEYASQCIKFN